MTMAERLAGIAREVAQNLFSKTSHRRGAARRTSLAEAMEPRLLLTAYGIKPVAAVPAFTTSVLLNDNTFGFKPSAVVADSHDNLYGTLFGNQSALFEVPAGGGSINILAQFPANTTGGLATAPTIDSGGDLFGTVGANIWEWVPGTTAVTTLATFDPQFATSGGAWTSTLTLDSAGNIYGTTQTGGWANLGAVFELAKGSNTITTIASFTTPRDSSYVPPAVTLDSNGDIFGTDSQTTVFEIPSGSSTLTDIAIFPAPYQNPSQLTIDASGNLFGTTMGVGNPDMVFEIPQGTQAISVLATFGPNYVGPTGVVVDSRGNLFGTTTFGGSYTMGSFFELPQGSNAITTIASFTPGYNDEWPFPTQLTIDSNNNLFGSTFFGTQSHAAGDDGTIFEIAAGTSTISVLASHPYFDAQPTSGGLVTDASGDIFGTLYGGQGSIFEIPAGSSAMTTVANFDGTSDSDPSDLAIDSQGNLFGTTYYGGADDLGTVFEIAAGTTGFTTVASFNGTNGSSPYSGVTLDSSGDLFGTVPHSTGSNFGAVFEIAAGSGAITLVSDLTSANDGDVAASPTGVVVDSSGDIFGTSGEWNENQGAVYEIPHGSSVATTLADFNSAIPLALTVDPQGDVFGTSKTFLNSGSGRVFEIPAGGSTLTTIATMAGFYPNSGLAIDSSGDLFGTETVTGGVAVYEVAAGSGTITTLNGTYPVANAIGVSVDASGDLFGTSNHGGAFNNGSVYEIVPVAGTSLSLQSTLPTVSYGQPATFTATVTGSGTPVGSVTFTDETTGAVWGTSTTPLSTTGNDAVWAFTPASRQLEATAGDTIEATFNPGANYLLTSSGTTVEVVTPRAITVTASPSSKTYDGDATTTAVPTVTSGILVSGDTPAFTETYTTTSIGSGLTLVPTGEVSDGNGGNNYAVTFVSANTGAITAAPTIQNTAFTIYVGPQADAWVGNVGVNGHLLDYTLSDLPGGNIAAAFQIDSQGNITIANPTLLPAVPLGTSTVGSSFDVNVTNNLTGVTTTAVVTVTQSVLAPKPPTFATYSQDFSALPTNSVGVLIGTISAQAGYAGQTFSYALTGPNSSTFSIDQSGNIHTTSSLVGGAAYSFNLVATDSGNPRLSSYVTCSVTVANVAIADTMPVTSVATTGTDDPLMGGSVTDVNSSTDVTVTVTVANPTLAGFTNVTTGTSTPAFATAGSPTPAFGSVSKSATTAPTFTKVSAGVYTFVGTPASASTALRGLIFKPSTTYKFALGATNALIGINAIDTQGANVSLPPATAVKITAPDTVPKFAGTATNTTPIPDSANGWKNAFGTLSIVDPDPGATETVTVSVPIVGGYPDGAFAESPSYTGTARFAPIGSNTGKYSVTGVPADVTAALDALQFRPRALLVTPGTTSSLTLTLTVSDGISTVTPTESVKVEIAGLADTAPTLTGLSASSTTWDLATATVKPFAGAVIKDSTTKDIVTITESSPSLGTLTGTGLVASKTAGIYTITGTPAAVTADLAGAKFVPIAKAVTSNSPKIENVALSVSNGAFSANGSTTITVSGLTALTATLASSKPKGTLSTGTAVATLAGTTSDSLSFSLVATGSAASANNAQFQVVGNLLETAMTVTPGTYLVVAQVVDGNNDKVTQGLKIVIGATAGSIALSGTPVITVG